MKTSTVETLVWVLIYGGLLVLSLGYFVGRQEQTLGNGLMLGGAAIAGIGVVLVYVRSRMKSPERKS
nr:hypothetical protein [uncultured Caldimonas sp.]